MESVPENLSGTSSAMRAYPLISADPLWRKIRKPEPRRFLWRKPEKKNQYASIQLRLTIHPKHPRVKGV